MDKEIKERIAAINSGIIPEGYKKTKVGIVPVEWERYKLSDISAELTEKAGNNTYETLSISAGIGFVNQANKFGKELSGKQYEKYIVLHKGDFSYNKGNSKKYPQGCIYQLKDRDEAAVPNVFESFRLNKGINDYYEQLFVSGFLNRQLFAKINHGVRDDGLLNLKGEDFYSCYVPSPPLPEQQKIAEILSTQDKLIELKQKLIEQKKQQKKWLMQNLISGKIRLKGFDGEWEKVRMSKILTEHGEKNTNQKYRICSVAVRKGVVDQIEHLGRSYAANDTSNYNVAHYGDIIYTKSPTGDFPYGIIKQNHLNELVAVSPLYGVFTPKNFATGYMLHTYFEYSINANNYLYSIVQKGAKNTININNKTFLSKRLYLPIDEKEQTAIAEILSQQDKEIQLLEQELDLQKQKKKALMQLLLTGIVRTK